MQEVVCLAVVILLYVVSVPAVFVIFRATFAVDLVALVLLTSATCLLRLQLVVFVFSGLYFWLLRWLSLF
jgi:hypothetical protein